MLSYELTLVQLRELCCSEKMLNHIVNAWRKGYIPDSFPYQLKEEMVSHIQKDYASEWRLEEVNLSHTEIYGKSKFPDMNYIVDIFDTYFHINPEGICCKKGYRSEYSRICRDIHPYTIIAAKMAKEIKHSRFGWEQFVQIAKRTSPLGLDEKTHKEYAENHIHHGGAGDPSASILLMSGQSKMKFKDLEKLKKGKTPEGVMSLYELMLLNKLFFNYSFALKKEVDTNSKSTLSEKPKKKTKIPETLPLFSELESILWNSLTLQQLALMERKGGRISYEKEVENVLEFCRCEDYSTALLLYMTYLFIQYDKTTLLYEKIYFLAHIHVINILRQSMVMNRSIGLERFVDDFYDSTLRKNGKNDCINAQGAFQSVTHLNFKTSDIPIKKPYEPYVPVTKTLCEKLLKHHPHETHHHNIELLKLGILCKSQNMIQQHCSFHFIKLKEKNKRIEYRYETIYKNYYQKTKSIDKWLNSSDSVVSLDKIFVNKEGAISHLADLSKQNIDLGALLRSLDAAGNELLVPPEVYAPFSRYLRHRSLVGYKDSMIDWLSAKRKHLKYSFHAGEDFAHIATGLRRIDETVLFLDYRSGD